MTTATQRDSAPSALSAVRNPDTPLDPAPKAGARAGAREDSADRCGSATTHSDPRPGLAARLRWELTPPEPWTHRPASLAAMWRYAKSGGWTGPTGVARQLGVWWYRLVALPVTVVCHYTAWLVARPSRALTATLVGLLVWQAVAR